MEHGIIINENELRVMLCLLDKRELSDVVKVEEGFSPEEGLIGQMEQKRFFIRDEGLDWNPFVHFVVSGVVDADCVLKTFTQDGSLCFLYFKEDEMFLLTRKADDSEIHIYFVPFIPKAIGGVSLFFDDLRETMQPLAVGDTALTAGAENADQIKDLLMKKSLLPAESGIAIRIQGEVLGERQYVAAVLVSGEGCVYASGDGQTVTCVAADYYTMIKKMADWAIEAHANCICWGNQYE